MELTPGILPAQQLRACETEYHQLVKSNSHAPDTETRAAALIEKFNVIWDFFRRGDFYSANEDLDEFSNGRLKFFLIPFYIGRLHTLFTGKARPTHLESAIAYFGAFSEEMTRLGIVDPEKPIPTSPADRRQFKVNEYKERKELEARLQRMNELTKSDDDRGNIGDRVDEETERELIIDLLHLSCIDARSLGNSAVEEIPLARMFAEGVKVEDQGPPPKMWIQRIDRESVRKSVFTPLEYVKPQPIPRSPSDDDIAQGPEKPKARIDASDDEEAEQARKEAEEWAQYKETHPPFSQM